jgi:hypothetical protein
MHDVTQLSLFAALPPIQRTARRGTIDEQFQTRELRAR